MSLPMPPDWVRAAFPQARAGIALQGSLADGAESPWLVHGPGGPRVLARKEGAVVQIDLSEVPVRHEAHLLRDQLHLDGQVLMVPRGQADAARELLAAARLEQWSGHGPCAPRPLSPGPWVLDPQPVDALWAGCRLEAGEVLIAWIPTTTEAPLVDPWEPGARAAWRWCITDRRHLLVALSPLGAALEVALAPGTVLVDGGGGCHAGDRRWQVERRRLPVARELAPICGLPPEDRLRESARTLGVREDEGARAHALVLLDHLAPLRRPLWSLRHAVLTRVRPPLPPALVAEIAALPGHPDASADELVSWVEAWSVPEELGRAVLAVLREVDPAYALPLHEVLHERAGLLLRGGKVDRAADLDLARHHLQAARMDGVEALLSGHVAALAPGGLDVRLPEPVTGPDPMAPASPADAEELGLLEALSTARRARGEDDPGLLAELARRQPLAPPRLQALVRAPSTVPPLRERAARALFLLQQGLPASTAPLPGATRPLPAADLSRLAHPVTHQGGPLAWLSAALARVEPLDSGALRDFCERLDPHRHPAAATALADAAVLLGLPAPVAFVSRGQRSVGLRACDGPEPFLVVGGDHLDAQGGYTMTAPELAFAIGAELAHLRWRHSRIAASDVWAGLWDKSTVALSATGALLPLLEVLRLPRHLTRLGAAGAGAMSTLRAVGDRVAPDTPGPVDVGIDDARLLSAHRAMQLSADRAGLLLCGDPVAAVRAMLLQHTRLRGELTVAERQGLLAALLRTDDRGQLLLPHLAARVASLLAFWLSDTYADLASKARGPAPSATT